MTSEIKRPDLTVILSSLKDFQRRTVDYAFRRMYQDADKTNRFLVADEVGLGKTLIARGLTALAVDALWDEVKRIDVLYICSNSAIARQNINKLNLTGNEFSLASRITMLPTELHTLNQRKLNFISFTPGTSFDLRSSMGMQRERVLIYQMLRSCWDLKGVSPQNALQGGAGAENFRAQIDGFDDEIDADLLKSYRAALSTQIVADREAKREDIRTRFDRLCSMFARVGERSNRSREAITLQREVVGQLRDILARTCLRALEPDLVILDEFQRFKHLLDDQDEESRLAQELFRYSDETSRSRVLLLSATPYKMFTTREEADGEDHYSDFVATLRFLQDDPVRTARCEDLLKEYRRALLRLNGNNDTVAAIQKELERELRSVMVRTERLAATPDRDGMLVQIPTGSITMTPHEALSYHALSGVSELLESVDPLEYWKSSPYLLSFMESYQLKKKLEDAIEDPEECAQLAALLSDALPVVLPWDDVQAYKQVDPGNARLRWLASRVIDSGAWRMLWVPPARPWYQPEGAFADPGLREFSKLLVFSSWQVVPKAVSALLSYEAERRMVTGFEPAAENTQKAREKFTPRLRFATDSGSSLLALTYPSVVLARILAEVENRVSGSQPSLAEVRQLVKNDLSVWLEKLPSPAGNEVDERWYWASPALMDALENPFATAEWLASPKTGTQWLGLGEDDEEDEGEEEDRVFLRVQYPELVRMVREKGQKLGPRPADLPDVLTDIALGSPAVSALRAFLAVTGAGATEGDVLTDAGYVGWCFRSYYNLQEVTSLIASRNSSSAYWHEILRYNAEGGLSAVILEYAHVLMDWLGLRNEPPVEASWELSDAMGEALTTRTSTMRVDDIRVASNKRNVSIEKKRMRSRFAARLGEEETETGGERTRIDHIRKAFNSPFWPFVLATTSVGQEGLDFHLYCHAVVHWNLPTNPVDLEQREGRVHRFKGHAVRKNVGKSHGGVAGGGLGWDPWMAMFQEAEMQRPANATDLWPYWVYPIAGGARIERHVPSLPLSRDQGWLERLRKALAVYRMVFGQPRQEELMAYLVSRISADQLEQRMASFRIDLSPPETR